MPACPANRRSWLRLALVAAAALGGCYATDPVLYPFAPSPNVPEGLLILQVPHAVVESMHSTHIADELGSVLLGNALKIGYEPITDERREQILSHQVVTGMTLREVTWSLMSDPARIRDQGPPGGPTLIWETPGGMQGSFWVRFDEDGRASDAGSY